MTSQLTASVALRVPFHDVDPARIVWHGRYFKYFELARCALLERIDYSYDQMAASGYVWPIVDFNVRFLRPVKYDQSIHISSELIEWDYRLRINYMIHDEENTLLTRATSDQVPLDQETGEMYLGSPDVLLGRIAEILGKESTDL